MYCVNIDLPLVSEIITLVLMLMVISEIILAIFEFPAALIDGILFVCMGNKAIAIGCGVVILIVFVFVFIIIYPKINWHKIFSFSPIKYAIIGFLLIIATIYTELFNGSYSFKDLSDFNEFKNEFSQYDDHFWPTKYIREVEDNGREIITKTSVYPWDVSISDGKQFAYKVTTFYYYDPHELYYYPFTYNTYAGVDPRRLLNENTVSESDLKQVSDSDS